MRNLQRRPVAGTARRSDARSVFQDRCAASRTSHIVVCNARDFPLGPTTPVSEPMVYRAATGCALSSSPAADAVCHLRSGREIEGARRSGRCALPAPASVHAVRRSWDHIYRTLRHWSDAGSVMWRGPCAQSWRFVQPREYLARLGGAPSSGARRLPSEPNDLLLLTVQLG